MKTATAGLKTFLATAQQIARADLYTITLFSGTILRYTSADINISYGGNSWLANGPNFERDSWKLTLGLTVDEMKITVFPKPTNLISGVSFLQACRNGALDRAKVSLDTALSAVAGNTTNGTINVFYGTVGDINVSRVAAELMVNSDLELLNVQMPRNLYQAGCVHTLYDTGCTLVKASFGANSIVTANSTLSQINCNLAQSAGYFDLGTITFNNGPNANVVRGVKSYTSGALQLSQPLIQVCNNGDAFTAFPGCDKLQATCVSKFNNVINFKGFPYLPLPEVAV